MQRAARSDGLLVSRDCSPPATSATGRWLDLGRVDARSRWPSSSARDLGAPASLAIARRDDCARRAAARARLRVQADESRAASLRSSRGFSDPRAEPGRFASEFLSRCRALIAHVALQSATGWLVRHLRLRGARSPSLGTRIRGWAFWSSDVLQGLPLLFRSRRCCEHPLQEHGASTRSAVAPARSTHRKLPLATALGRLEERRPPRSATDGRAHRGCRSWPRHAARPLASRRCRC